MKNNEFRTPLLQSLAVLIAIIVLISLFVPSSDPAAGPWATIVSFFSGLLHTILFAIALVCAVIFSLVVLIAIFLGAMALHDKGRAASMYDDLRQRITGGWHCLAEKLCCCETTASQTTCCTEEEGQMKEDMAQLRQLTMRLQTELTTVKTENEQLHNRMQHLDQTVADLQRSGKKTDQILEDLTTKVDTHPDTSINDQVQQLEEMVQKAVSSLEALSERVTELEEDSKQAPTAGIFSYIADKKDQDLLADAVQQAIAQEMTYAQIDAYLTEKLPAKLDTIVKEHPSLTKNYIRNLRR